MPLTRHPPRGAVRESARGRPARGRETGRDAALPGQGVAGAGPEPRPLSPMVGVQPPTEGEFEMDIETALRAQNDLITGLTGAVMALIVELGVKDPELARGLAKSLATLIDQLPPDKKTSPQAQMLQSLQMVAEETRVVPLLWQKPTA